tara:strand:+ start:4270 stop:4857 length:588 start_codon:yes stop_codon:yes gene_type:complete
MAIKTMTLGNAQNLPAEGWHLATVNKAEYGDYQGTRYIDVWFNGFPENLNARVYEAKNKTTQEEFRIAQVFRFANAGIKDVLDDPTGKKPVVQYDDSAVNLVGKDLNVFIYKNEDGYLRVLRDFAPNETTNGEMLTFSSSDVEYWKGRAEKYYKDYVLAKSDQNDFTTASVDEIKEMVSQSQTETSNDKGDDLPF